MVKVTKEDLQNALDDVSYRTEEMQEKLYKNNIELRPTIMQKIIDREVKLFEHIKYCVEECEKETGRVVMFPISFFS